MRINERIKLINVLVTFENIAMSREQAERIWQEDLAELTAENNFL